MSGQGQLHRNLLIGVGGAILIVLALAATLNGGFLNLSGPTRILAGTAGMALLVLWWGVFALRIVRAQDEYQRWMERRSWYVGGLAGLLVSVPVFTFIGLGGPHWLGAAPDMGPAAKHAFADGYMLPVMLQVVGSTTYALWRRLAKR